MLKTISKFAVRLWINASTQQPFSVKCNLNWKGYTLLLNSCLLTIDYTTAVTVTEQFNLKHNPENYHLLQKKFQKDINKGEK